MVSKSFSQRIIERMLAESSDDFKKVYFAGVPLVFDFDKERGVLTAKTKYLVAIRGNDVYVRMPSEDLIQGGEE